MTTGLFDGHDPESFFDDAVCSDGAPRPHYEALVRRLAGFMPHQLAEREQVRDAAFGQAGIPFTVYGEGEGVERIFPMDLVPRLIPAHEWAHLEEGLVQRVTALNPFRGGRAPVLPQRPGARLPRPRPHYWGTRVDTFGIREPHVSLELTAEASVETMPRPLVR